MPKVTSAVSKKKKFLTQWWQDRISKKKRIRDWDEGIIYGENFKSIPAAAAAEEAAAEEAAAEEAASPRAASSSTVLERAASPRAASSATGLERAISTLTSGRAPGRLRRAHPSAINPIPSRYQEIVMPEQYRQKPSYETIKDAHTVSRSLEEQTHFANLQIGQMQHMTNTLGIQAQIAPDIKDIINKLINTDSTYWARTTDITAEQIIGIKEWIHTKIQKHIISSDIRIIYLIIDFQNVFGCLRDLIGPTSISENMMEIADILCSLVQYLHNNNDYAPIGIILCAHNNTLNKNPDFYNLINELNRCTRLTGFNSDIIVIPTHNRGQLDDYMLVVVGEILNGYRPLQQTSYFILTSDLLRDMKDISTQLSRIISIDDVLFNYYSIPIPPMLSEKEKRDYIRRFKAGFNKTKPYINLRRALDPRYWQSTPYTGGKQGRTMKYKKSLLNKRTRKIYKKNYSRKMKKYSKNKKKKTLRRRL